MPAGLAPQFSHRLTKKQPALLVYRGLILYSFFAAWLFYSVLRAIEGETSGGKSPGVLLYVLAAAWLSDLLLILRMRGRPVWRPFGKAEPPSDPVQLAVSYRAYFMIGWAFTMSALSWGFVAFFILAEHKLAIYLIGAAVSCVLLLLIAPTRKRIDAQAQQLTEAGSPWPLRDALMIPLADLPKGDKPPTS